MSVHKLTAGTGYTYLTRQVAAHDRSGGARTSLASYYTERGETPGHWFGSGVAGIDGLSVGDEVTAAQMQALFGAGLHPLAQRRERLEGPGLTEADYRSVTRLGAPFKVYVTDVTAFQVEVARRIEEYAAALGHPRDYPIEAADRARIRTQVALEFFRGEHGRDPVDARELSGTIARHSRPRTTAVAGYDLTFFPVKSVSTLWAVAPPEVAAQIELAHHDAVTHALRFLEAHALYTREGANGIRQVDVTGLVAAAFTHRDSRAGDPDLHTHVAVANKVQTRTGKWLSLDGRILFKANVTASETYNTALETNLRTRLGLVFDQRPGTGTEADRGKRPVREIVGVDLELNMRWSTRRAGIEARRSELAATFQADHGRPPTAVEAIQLAQQATLETREAKHEPRTLFEQRHAWAEQAEEVLGGPRGIATMLRDVLSARPTAQPVTVNAAWVGETALRVRDEVQSRRATWQIWHIRAEAQRQVRAAALPAEHVQTIVDAVTDRALSVASVRITSVGDGVPDPPELRRADGSSVYDIAGSALFTSTEILTAEARLLSTAGAADRRPASPEAVALTLLEQAANGVTLNAGQASLVRGMATSGARLQLAIAPAGAGKTTAMRALAAAWVEDGGTVLGLAPSAAAATVLREQIGATTDTLAKLTWSLEHNDLPDWANTIGPGTLVVIDEAGMADTLTLDTAVEFVTARGGQVRLIGDTQQLAAIGGGGVLRDIAATHGALHLSELMRFADPAEGAASLALRDGRTEALGFYLDHHRVHVGDLTTMTQDLFTAWAHDRDRHVDTIMLAPTRTLVSELNQRAQAHRITGSLLPGSGLRARLADGNTAYVGDTVLTRANDRRLRMTTHDWVKNGDRWTVRAVTRNGSLAVEHLHTGRHLTLPAGYVTASVELGYASTTHAAQGISVATMHGLATGVETRQQLYTMLTRGADANHLYLQVVGDGDPHAVIHPDHVHPPTATDLLEDILARDGAPTSATTTQRENASATAQLGPAATRYVDALHVAADQHLGPGVIAALQTSAEQVVPGITQDPAWPTLRSHLALLAVTGTNPITALRFAASSQALDTAGDRAAVLDWRLDDTNLRHAGPGPLPWLPGIPHALRANDHWGTYLTARSNLVTDLAADVRENATAIATATDAPAWWRTSHVRPAPDLFADLTVWRAATSVPDSDHRPTGPKHLAKAHALWQRSLDHRLGHTHTPALAAWVHQLHTLAPDTRHDAFTPQLAARLASVARAGIDAHTLLRTAVAAPLPDDHAGSALWWRISRHLTPAVAHGVDCALPLTPSWAARLPHTVGEQNAATLQTSPWWPALVTTIDHALAHGGRLEDLLSIIEDLDDTADVEMCQALVWRISLLTDPAPTPDNNPPEDEYDQLEWIPPSTPGLEPAHQAERGAAADDHAAATLKDLHAALTATALARTGMGVLEPSPAEVEAMVAHAAAWDDAPFTPDRAAHLNTLARDYYTRVLDAGWAGPYLRERLHTDLAPAGAGYAPPGWTHLVTHLRAHDVTDDEMLAVGLATRARTGTLIDRFRDRLVLPITVDGTVVGFVGRRHPRAGDDHGPRYLNTPTTALFHKGDVLYGVDHQLLDTGAIPVLVEGPLDALAVTAAGQGRFLGVAPLGTSLTHTQARLLATLHPEPIIATDADPAGRIAAQRAYWLLTQHAVSPRSVALPEGADPAALLHDDGPDALRDALNARHALAQDLIGHKLAQPPSSTALKAWAAVVVADTPALWIPRAHDLIIRADAKPAEVMAALTCAGATWNRDPAFAAQRQLQLVAKHPTEHTPSALLENADTADETRSGAVDHAPYTPLPGQRRPSGEKWPVPPDKRPAIRR